MFDQKDNFLRNLTALFLWLWIAFFVLDNVSSMILGIVSSGFMIVLKQP